MPAESGTSTAAEEGVPPECEKKYRLLCLCHRRFTAETERERLCKHLNRAVAECMVALACPEEWEALRSLCNSGGTALKRSQCEQARVSLSACISSHQQQ